MTLIAQAGKEGVNVCGFEKRVFKECGDERRRGWLPFRVCTGASR
jgi:hypothetical protein